MRHIPLRLDAYFFDITEVRVNVDYDRDAGCDLTQLIQVKKDFFRHKSDETAYQVLLEVALKSSEEQKTPYNVYVTTRGFFKFNDDVPEERKQALIENGTFSILYGATREYIASLTSRGPFGPMIIPPVQFPVPTKPRPETEQSALAKPAEKKLAKQRKKTSTAE